MKQRVLGKSGLEVSAIGLGCMGLSHGYGKPTKDDEAIALIRNAVEIGYTFFDTAETYGTSDDPHANEVLLGKALKSIRDKVIIATKFGVSFDLESNIIPLPIITNSSEGKIRESIEGSLQRLQTDYIDIYFQHRIDPNVKPEEVASVMLTLMKEGKIRHWGISEANEEYIRRAHAVCPITAIENRYSMMARKYETLFPVLEELGIGFVAFSPIANGFLSGAYTRNNQFDKETDYRSTMPQFKPEAIQKNEQLMELIQNVADQKKATPAQISMAWMLCKKPWLIPIPGTRNMERLLENAKASEIELSIEEVKKLDDALNSIVISDVFGGTKIKKQKVEEA